MVSSLFKDLTTEGIPRVDRPDHEKLARVEPTNSPPPNCAICLGSCANKCFTDCCLHQFCFNCLLEWSKIKAECPLCKQPFKSIIYNIKSNSEYEEHVIGNPEREIVEEELLEIDDPYNNFYLPNGPRPQRHFQFRTTLTVDHGGELAIQELLLSHPLTNSIYFPTPLNRYNANPLRSITFRRSIYQNNWWAAPDFSGRYRECTPAFFRENPGQLHRVQPWLNRELGALMIDLTSIYVTQQNIMDLLTQCQVVSNTFKTAVLRYFGRYTDHFIHEFYHFLRSPFDMIGYDAHVRYNFRRSDSPIIRYQTSDSDSDDSDVRVIDSPNDCIYVPPRTPEVIVIHSDNSDSDVIYQAPTPPPVVVVDDSDTDEENRNANVTVAKLPIKLRLKLKKKSKKSSTRRKRYSSLDSCHIDSSDSEFDYSRYKAKVRYRVSDFTGKSSDSNSSTSNTSSDSSSSTTSSCSSDSDDVWTPVKTESKYGRQKISKRRKSKKESSSYSKYKKKCTSRKEKKRNRSDSSDSDVSSERKHKSRRSNKRVTKHKKYKKRDMDKSKKVSKRLKVDSNSSKNEESDCNSSFNEENNTEKSDLAPVENVKQELPTSIPLSSLQTTNFLNLKQEEACETESYDPDVPGPSSSVSLGNLRGASDQEMWYRRPVDNTSSSNSE